MDMKMSLIFSYPTPGIISRTNAVDVTTHAMSPDWRGSQLQAFVPEQHTTMVRLTDAVVYVQILRQGISTRCYGAIVGHRVFRHCETTCSTVADL